MVLHFFSARKAEAALRKDSEVKNGVFKYEPEQGNALFALRLTKDLHLTPHIIGATIIRLYDHL